MFASARAEAIKRKQSEAPPGANAHEPETQSPNLIVDTSAQISAGEPPFPETLTETNQSKDINADSLTNDFNGAPPALLTQAQRSESENIDTETPAKHSNQVEITSDGVTNDENAHSTPSALKANAPLDNSLPESVPVAHKQQIEENLAPSSPLTAYQETTGTGSTEIVMEDPVPEDHPVIKSEKLPWIPFEWSFQNTGEPIKVEDSFTANEDTGLENLKRGRSSSFENELFVPETSNGPSKKAKVESEETTLRKLQSFNEHAGRSLRPNENSNYITLSDDEDGDTANIPDDDNDDNVVTISDDEDGTEKDLSDDDDDLLDGDADEHLIAQLNKEIKDDSQIKKKKKKSTKIKIKKEKNDDPKSIKPRRMRTKTLKDGSKKTSSNSSKKRTKSKATKPGFLQSFAITNQIAEEVADDGNDVLPEVPEMPETSAKTTKNALEEMLTRCPESDLHKGRRDKAALDRALTRIGKKKTTPINGKWLLEGMKQTSALQNHQVIGVDWMVARELANEGLEDGNDDQKSNGPLGGMLCDTMGLGKTVEVLATMLLNPPESSVPEEKQTTLIVVPPCVLSQWKREITNHCAKKDFRRVMIYRARNDEDDEMSDLADQNIVLTYYDIRKSCPWPLKDVQNILHQEDRKKKKLALKGNKLIKSKASMVAQDDETTGLENWIEVNRVQGGSLHKMEWYRVILDEAHVIKNHQSRSSLAANALKGKHRWIVTGTPCMNRLEELYAYFRFLKDPNTTSFLKFQGEFCDFHDERCRNDLESALSGLCIRRTMNDKIAGAPIVRLKKVHHNTLKIKQPPAERVLYRAIWERLVEMINANYHKLDPRRSLSYFLAQLQVLRKATAHPLLVERQIRMMFSVERLERIAKEMQDLQAKIPNMDMAIHAHILRLIDQKIATGDIEDSFEPLEEASCGLCYDTVTSEDDPKQIPKCKHVFCLQCLEAKLHEQLGIGGEEEPICPTCNINFDFDQIQKFQLNVDSKKNKGAAISTDHKVNVKGKDAAKHRPGGVEELTWLQKFDNDEIKFLESAKTRALRQQLLEWSTNAPTEKIIIFSQWVKVYTIVGLILSDMDIKFVYYSGDMNLSQRDQALKWFQKKPEIRVMVAGIRCGGQGLNLTCANRVISIDLWWNSCVENQAFGRVYRMGQDLETYFTRLVVQKTMDSRILKMQERKMKMIDTTFQDISVEDIAELLGRVEKDKNGKLKIILNFDEDDDEDPGIPFDDEE